MRTMKIFFIIAIVMALAVKSYSTDQDHSMSARKFVSPKRASRFLADEKNSRASDHCHKDNDVCYEHGSEEPTCCNNKCVDLKNDFRNCGACKTKCNYTQTCCNGECVDLSSDEKHCGGCHKKCMTGGCISRICYYA